MKEEGEYDRLRKEQQELREELDPNSRERLREIRIRLKEVEPRVEEWRAQREREKARREVVTTKYNSWIKTYTAEHGKPPTEKDIPVGTEISEMFHEYQRYREDGKRAKGRMARAEAMKSKAKYAEEEKKVREWISEFEAEHGRKPTRSDLPPGTEIEKTYTSWLAREGGEGSVTQERVQKLKAELAEWKKGFEAKNGRPPTQKDIDEDTRAASLTQELDKRQKGGGKKPGAKREGRRSVVRNRADSKHRAGSQPLNPAQGRDDEAWTDLTADLSAAQFSPTNSYPYESPAGSKPAGCGACCSVM
eukprot:Hpha_TRINITY_DN15970_c1_g1::TRINITY_DN15970_c1_g1_i10::g.71443::m.71443